MCMSTLDARYRGLGCGHLVHRECVIQSMRPECPICRAPVLLTRSEEQRHLTERPRTDSEPPRAPRSSIDDGQDIDPQEVEQALQEWFLGGTRLSITDYVHADDPTASTDPSPPVHMGTTRMWLDLVDPGINATNVTAVRDAVSGAVDRGLHSMSPPSQPADGAG